MSQVGSVIICNDIRKEITNKDILIGVYGGDIIISKFPAKLRIAFWIEYIPDRADKIEVNFRIGLKGKSPTDVKGVLDLPELKTAIIAVPGLELLVEEESELILELSDKEGEWRIIKTKQIKRGQVASAFSSPRNSVPG